ncbi:MAG: hypothetical protein IJC30_04045, partial [Alphaproteobacteria bacterium]|nr:hypothetical protein [Alphaproteobacteria bacterium]
GEILSKCEGGKQRNPETCECECPEGKVECDGECKVPPTPKPCEKLSEDKCSTVSLCTAGQECCGGQCITACKATNCEKCDSSSSSCVKDEANCGDCKDEWSGTGEPYRDGNGNYVACNGYNSVTSKCLGTCYLAGSYSDSFTDGVGCYVKDGEKTDRECCPTGKVVCGPSSAQKCCDACNTNNTGCCEASKTCGTNCCEHGCLSDNVTCAESRADSDCANGGTCCDGKCCANACSSDGKSCAQCDEDSDCASDCLKCNMDTRTCEDKCPDGQHCFNNECTCGLNETKCGDKCCGENETCSGGTCVCKAGTTVCGDTCCNEGQECKNGTTCCDIIDKSKCPNGETMIASDGCEICKCESDTSCPAGQKLVKNYLDNIGACGEVCCEVKEDGYTRYEEAEGDGVRDYYKEAGYTVVGAVNGSCCATFTEGYGEYYEVWDGEIYSMERYETTSNARILNNNGYYCGSDFSTVTYSDDLKWTNTTKHVSPSQCISEDSAPMGTIYWCSSADKGDPCKSSSMWECTAE